MTSGLTFPPYGPYLPLIFRVGIIFGHGAFEEGLRNWDRNTPNADPISIISSTVMRTYLFYNRPIGLLMVPT